MEIIKKITRWGDAHHAKWMLVFRILLGVILFSKGLTFARHPHDIILKIQGVKLEFISSYMLVRYVPYVQLVGGLFIAIGLLTRVSILFQLPILVGAIIFVNSSLPFFSIYSDLLQSVTVLILLLVFLIVGSGPRSVDLYVKKETELS